VWINYEVKGGLEPGETYKLDPGSECVQRLGKVEAPKDAIIAVTVLRLDGAKGVTLYDATFSAAEEGRLAALQKQYEGKQ
jgi:hypothetical protein